MIKTKRGNNVLIKFVVNDPWYRDPLFQDLKFHLPFSWSFYYRYWRVVLINCESNYIVLSFQRETFHIFTRIALLLMDFWKCKINSSPSCFSFISELYLHVANDFFCYWICHLFICFNSLKAKSLWSKRFQKFFSFLMIDLITKDMIWVSSEFTV